MIGLEGPEIGLITRSEVTGLTPYRYLSDSIDRGLVYTSLSIVNMAAYLLRYNLLNSAPAVGGTLERLRVRGLAGEQVL